ncbi:MAG: N-acetyltransferase DgcN [Pseudomonadota bacterium]
MTNLAQIQTPYLLFLGDAHDALAAKVARGIAIWRPQSCVGQLRLAGCKADLGLYDLTIEAAVEAGARTMVIGVANRGGTIPDHWLETLEQAMAHGLDLASGLHTKLHDFARLKQAALHHGRAMVDVRSTAESLDVATGEKRSGRRLLTVGTDCSVGKMFTSLAIERAMHDRGMKADFRATGQTGVLICGQGICVDAVIADFISGAVEALSPANDSDHWDLIEGQGSLFHPSFAGVSLGLLHGAQPDALVLCHEPGRAHMRGLPGRALPDLQHCAALNIEHARLVNPDCRMVGVAINSTGLGEQEARDQLSRLEDQMQLPATDPVRFGADRLLDRL